eukprot:6464366-Amphidinium_carterae.1
MSRGWVVTQRSERSTFVLLLSTTKPCPTSSGLSNGLEMMLSWQPKGQRIALKLQRHSSLLQTPHRNLRFHGPISEALPALERAHPDRQSDSNIAARPKAQARSQGQAVAMIEPEQSSVGVPTPPLGHAFQPLLDADHLQVVANMYKELAEEYSVFQYHEEGYVAMSSWCAIALA